MVTGLFSKKGIRKRHQAKHKKLGLCIRCSKKAIKGQVLCEFHREINRFYGNHGKEKEKNEPKIYNVD